jgi:hypothetical protein
MSAVEKEMRGIEVRFLRWNGAVDLLQMSTALSPAEFRRYIELSRQWRAARRAERSSQQV